MRLPDAPVALVAPAGAFDPERLARGVAMVRERGIDLVPLEGLESRHRYLAGTDDHRLASLLHALGDPGFGAVWIARGGYGLTRILDRFSWDDLPPRPVIGFSDVTALHVAVRRNGGTAIHGPVVHSLPLTDSASLDHLFDLLAGRPVKPMRGEVWVPGEAEGPLLGGNLCVLGATCGTRWQLDARGAILVIEEIAEPAYRIDRLVQQLASAGVLDGVIGVAIGSLVSCRVPDGVRWTLRDVLVEAFGPLGVPVLAELPIGHGAANRAFVWGSTARITGSELRLGADGRA